MAVMTYLGSFMRAKVGNFFETTKTFCHFFAHIPTFGYSQGLLAHLQDLKPAGGITCCRELPRSGEALAEMRRGCGAGRARARSRTCAHT